MQGERLVHDGLLKGERPIVEGSRNPELICCFQEIVDRPRLCVKIVAKLPRERVLTHTGCLWYVSIKRAWIPVRRRTEPPSSVSLPAKKPAIWPSAIRCIPDGHRSETRVVLKVRKKSLGGVEPSRHPDSLALRRSSPKPSRWGKPTRSGIAFRIGEVQKAVTVRCHSRLVAKWRSNRPGLLVSLWSQRSLSAHHTGQRS
jgi:hypothetical protein